MGRRTLHMLGLAGMCICAIIMTAALALLVCPAKRSSSCAATNTFSVNVQTFFPFLVCDLTGQCAVDELHLHAGHLWLRGLF